jgi:plastocyanin
VTARPVVAGTLALVALIGAAALGPSAPKVHTVTAIDYHFHDAHPTPALTLEDTLRFSNQGHSLHNVTFPSVGYSEDFRPGEEIVIERLGDLFDAPGRYVLFCVYHAERGMFGTLVIVG